MTTLCKLHFQSPQMHKTLINGTLHTLELGQIPLTIPAFFSPLRATLRGSITHGVSAPASQRRFALSNREMDVGLHGWVSTPGTAGHVPKVHHHKRALFSSHPPLFFFSAWKGCIRRRWRGVIALSTSFRDLLLFFFSCAPERLIHHIC